MGDPEAMETTRISNEDLYDLVTGLIRTTESNHVQLTGQVGAIERRLACIEKQMSLLVAAIAIKPVLRSNAVRDEKKGHSQASRVV